VKYVSCRPQYAFFCDLSTSDVKKHWVLFIRLCNKFYYVAYLHILPNIFHIYLFPRLSLRGLMFGNNSAPNVVLCGWDTWYCSRMKSAYFWNCACLTLLSLCFKLSLVYSLVVNIQDRWIFPSQSWEVRNSIIIIIIIIIIIWWW